jgi:hypothetical protein
MRHGRSLFPFIAGGSAARRRREGCREVDGLGRVSLCLASVQAVARALEYDESCAGDELRGAAAGQFEQIVLVGVALDDEGQDADPGEIGTHVDRGVGVEGGQQHLERQVDELAPGGVGQQRRDRVPRAEERFCREGLEGRTGIAAERLPAQGDRLGETPSGLSGALRSIGALGALSTSPAILPCACADR